MKLNLNYLHGYGVHIFVGEKILIKCPAKFWHTPKGRPKSTPMLSRPLKVTLWKHLL